jgi:hypothetical protein
MGNRLTLWQIMQSVRGYYDFKEKYRIQFARKCFKGQGAGS